MKYLSCFKTYDIRGEIGVDIDENISYRIGRSTSQHFKAKSVIVGYDARETSPAYASAVANGIQDYGSDVIEIGLAGTEEMYWAVTQFGSCAGIEVTASHNPKNYNGMKIVKSKSQPLHEEKDLKAIKRIAETELFKEATRRGRIADRSLEARAAYVDKVLSFIDISALTPLKIVVNSGNGAAGPTFDAITKKLSTMNSPLDFIRINHNPDSSFPNGIPNPLLLKNHAATGEVVKKVGADFGVAFDGDFDRCFFFDNNGNFVQGEYIVGLLAAIFLDKELGGTVVHDPRVIWNTKSVIAGKGGVAVQSKTGHAFIKQAMRTHKAIYGGEISAHHYFRDFSYCDSGMITWLLIAELVSKSERSLTDMVQDRFHAFPSSGEINFHVENVQVSINRVVESYRKNALSLDDTDGFSLVFPDWRFNLRPSNTEPLVRLNVERCGGATKIQEKVDNIADLIGGTKI